MSETLDVYVVKPVKLYHYLSTKRLAYDGERNVLYRRMGNELYDIGRLIYRGLSIYYFPRENMRPDYKKETIKELMDLGVIVYPLTIYYRNYSVTKVIKRLVEYLGEGHNAGFIRDRIGYVITECKAVLKRNKDVEEFLWELWEKYDKIELAKLKEEMKKI